MGTAIHSFNTIIIFLALALFSQRSVNASAMTVTSLWDEQDLWPLLHPAIRSQSRTFGLIFGQLIWRLSVLYVNATPSRFFWAAAALLHMMSLNGTSISSSVCMKPGKTPKKTSVTLERAVVIVLMCYHPNLVTNIHLFRFALITTASYNIWKHCYHDC